MKKPLTLRDLVFAFCAAVLFAIPIGWVATAYLQGQRPFAVQAPAWASQPMR